MMWDILSRQASALASPAARALGEAAAARRSVESLREKVRATAASLRSGVAVARGRAEEAVESARRAEEVAWARARSHGGGGGGAVAASCRGRKGRGLRRREEEEQEGDGRGRGIAALAAFADALAPPPCHSEEDDASPDWLEWLGAPPRGAVGGHEG